MYRDLILTTRSGSVSSDSLGELHVLGHDGDSSGVDGTEVGVLEKTNHVGLRGFLESKDGGRLESEVVLVLGGDLSDESLERKLSDEELGGFLESSDFSEGNGAGSESVGSLDSTGSLLSGLGGNVLSWLLGSGVLSGSVFGSGHFELKFRL